MNVKNLVLGVGIVIVFALTLWQGIEAFYPSPQYDQYCTNQNYYYGPYPTPIKSGDVNCTVTPTFQQQNECSTRSGSLMVDTYDANGCPATFVCDFCNTQFNDAQKGHARFVFFIAVIVGFAALILGYAFLTVEPVGSALMGSAVWSFFYGTVVNWANFSNIWRFALLAVALALLVWITLRLNRPQRKGLSRIFKRR